MIFTLQPRQAPMPQPIRSSSESWHGTSYFSQSACTAASIGVGPHAITRSGLRAKIAASSGRVTSARSPREPSSLTAVTAQGDCVMP